MTAIAKASAHRRWQVASHAFHGSPIVEPSSWGALANCLLCACCRFTSLRSSPEQHTPAPLHNKFGDELCAVSQESRRSIVQVALAGVAAAALLTAQVPASHAAGVTSAPSSAVSCCLRLLMLSSLTWPPLRCRLIMNILSVLNGNRENRECFGNHPCVNDLDAATVRICICRPRLA